jgi:hypothetical protein
MEDKNIFNVPKSVKKESEKIEITIEEVIPQGDSLGNKIINKKKVDDCKNV